MTTKQFDTTVRQMVKISGNRIANIAIPITVHTCRNGVIIVNSHGLGGSKEGYSNKYFKIAEMLQRRNIGAVIRYQYSLSGNFEKSLLLIETLRSVIRYALNNSRAICESDSPEIYLAGLSAGASASSAVASEFPQVTKMLLIAPSADVGIENIKGGLSLYKGELFITVGDNDHIIGPESAEAFAEWASNATLKKVAIAPNCDHQFTGETNGRILSKAYLWAFKGDATYPSSEGGINLY